MRCIKFRICYVLGWRVCFALVAGALVVNLPAWNLPSAFCFVGCHTVCDHIVFVFLSIRRLIRTDTGCASDVVGFIKRINDVKPTTSLVHRQFSAIGADTNALQSIQPMRTSD